MSKKKDRQRAYTLRRKRNNTRIYQLGVPNEIHLMLSNLLDDKHRARLSVTCKSFHEIYHDPSKPGGKKEHACKYCGIWYPDLTHIATRKKWIGCLPIVKRKHFCKRCYAERHCHRCVYINESIPLNTAKMQRHMECAHECHHEKRYSGINEHVLIMLSRKLKEI